MSLLSPYIRKLSVKLLWLTIMFLTRAWASNIGFYAIFRPKLQMSIIASRVMVPTFTHPGVLVGHVAISTALHTLSLQHVGATVALLTLVLVTAHQALGGTPCEHNKTPCEHNKTPCEHNKTPCEHNKTPCEHNKTPCEHNKTPCKHNKTPCEHNKTPCEHNKTPCEHNKTLG